MGAIFALCLQAITSAAADPLEEGLAKLKTLHEKGLITKEDYDKQRSKLLDATLIPKQQEPPAADKTKVVYACIFTGEADVDAHAWDSQQYSEDADANTIVKELVDMVGAAPNFVVRPGNVPNAAAIIEGFDRYVVYSPPFMNEMKGGTKSNWSLYSILAHEIGHHFNGHTLRPGGSRPNLELEADEFSGHILARMGATLQEAQAAMKLLAPEQGGPTHPGKSKRLAAIEAGWKKASKNKAEAPRVRQQPEPSTPPPKLRICVHKVPCTHFGPCKHQTPCVHTVPCSHQIPCGHTIPCGHQIPCQHPYGFGRLHLFDILHPFDTVHPFDYVHVSDQAHEYDLVHLGDPLHEFDLEHPEGDP